MTECNPTAPPTTHHRAIAHWLLACCALVFCMVVLGGITRLTGSGLSMVEWEPVFGILPPLSQDAWEEVFAKYQQSPEFRKINFGMDLEGFKGIFWLEYLHRLLGRLIGVVFLVPLLFFLVTRRVPRWLAPRLVGLFLLGGLQGLLGWYMVKSGLVDNPHVSQYRLTAHLLLAVLVYGYMLWVALDLLVARSQPQLASHQVQSSPRFLAVLTHGMVALIVLTITSGGFVAGLKAGLAYNTFPLMAGQWIPPGLFVIEPRIYNLFENIATVQFNHRVLALLTLLAVVLLWFAARRHQLPIRIRYAYHGLLGMGLLQVTLGIATLLLHVPIELASAHQAGALVLFTVALFLAHELRGLRFSALTAEAPATQPA